MGLDNLNLEIGSAKGSGLDGIGKGQDRTKTITYRVSPAEHKALKLRAANAEITLTELIDNALAAYKDA